MKPPIKNILSASARFLPGKNEHDPPTVMSTLSSDSDSVIGLKHIHPAILPPKLKLIILAQRHLFIKRDMAQQYASEINNKRGDVRYLHRVGFFPHLDLVHCFPWITSHLLENGHLLKLLPFLMHPEDYPDVEVYEYDDIHRGQFKGVKRR